MLDERKRQVLQAIIDDYISTAEPIGSRTIARKAGLGVSPATIRNEMSDLELARALVLAEPADGLQDAFPRVLAGMSADERRSTRQAQVAELETRYERGAQMFRGLLSGLEADPQRYVSMSREQIWAELHKSVFGTDDPAEIAAKFTREERRGARLGQGNV